MADYPELPPRPSPPRRPGDLVGAWLAWFGVVRLLTMAVCVVIVGAGVFWLVQEPTPQPEAGLPVASPGSAPAISVTLPPPPAIGHAPQIVVHVAGAVASPGVYELDPGERIHAAVAAAGGPTGVADLEGLNLAAPLVDGARVYVPVKGEVDPASVPSGMSASGEDDGVSRSLDLNRATAEQFEALPGVGPATAAAIIGDRERNGPFASVDDLDRVPGIGPAKLSALRDLVSV